VEAEGEWEAEVDVEAKGEREAEVDAEVGGEVGGIPLTITPLQTSIDSTWRREK